MSDARLVLSDGTIFRGRSVGATGTTTGEAVFNTGLTGYQEVLSDPSYSGQIVTMTYPEIGNYGVVPADMESAKAQVAGFVMRRCCPRPSNFRSAQALGEFLADQGIVAIEDIDTRALTRQLRVTGAMPALLTSDDISDAELIERAAALPSMAGQDLASDAGTSEIYQWDEAVDPADFGGDTTWPAVDAHVVAIDLGVKRNILRLLRSCGFRVTVVPARTSADEIRALKPDGIFVSNGPGDPAAVTHAIATVRDLANDGTPMFGICLGHQILALAHGAKTFKLKFGHRGANHPIQRLSTGAVEIASHNHGFAVDIDSLGSELELTHLNLNDRTCAGFRHNSKPIFSVQYHPEACPGPSDPLYLFQQFSDLIAGAHA
ncbi:MAG: glutamine-hydrolyzing carbamoyl-phosphate synthase small subunit [Planctomycetota bacterium]|jgi:carbamoyl-phosphate synthase small subunit